jgi:hypothetical protein
VLLDGNRAARHNRAHENDLRHLRDLHYRLALALVPVVFAFSLQMSNAQASRLEGV